MTQKTPMTGIHCTGVWLGLVPRSGRSLGNLQIYHKHLAKLHWNEWSLVSVFTRLTQGRVGCMLLAELLIAHVGNEGKPHSTLKWDYMRDSFWYFSIKGIDVIIIKLISWYGRGARSWKSILPPWLSDCRLFFSRISVLQQLFSGLRSYLIRLQAKCTRLSFQHSKFYFMNVSLGIKWVQLCWKQSHSSNSNMMA